MNKPVIIGKDNLENITIKIEVVIECKSNSKLASMDRDIVNKFVGKVVMNSLGMAGVFLPVQ